MKSDVTNTVIIICGPTAVGKTAFAIELAKDLGTEIISADSRQCYAEMTIGVAKPTVDELQAVTHHFIGTYSVTADVHAVLFEQYALQHAESIFAKNKYVVMVGGTGLYIKAFCEGLDDMPDVDPQIRQKINEDYAIYGLGWLQEQVQNKDPEFWKIAEQQNPRRLMRALEIITSTGKSITTFRTSATLKRPFNVLKIGLELPRAILNQRIDDRVDVMIQHGLLAEVEQLLPYRHLNALQTVGYREIFDYLENNISLETAIEQIKTHTRQYAKRQMTWFKKDEQVHWLTAGAENNLQAVLQLLKNLQ